MKHSKNKLMKREPGPYPKTPPTHGTIVLTVHGQLYHQNEFPRLRAMEAIDMAAKLAEGFATPQDHLGAIMLVLADVPAEPLLRADPQRKGSVLGLVTLGYLLSRTDQASRIKGILSAGDGVLILRVDGTLEDATLQAVEVFDTWDAYSQFARYVGIAESSDIGSNSSLL